MRWDLYRVALVVAASASLMALGRPASAAPRVFFGRDASVSSMPRSELAFHKFTNLLTSFGVDDVETDVGPNPTLDFGAVGILADTVGVMAQTDPGLGIAIDSQSLLELDAVGAPQVNTTFAFRQYITAFGIHVIDGGDNANNNPTTFRLRDTATNVFTDITLQVGPGRPFGNVYFFGVMDTVPFDEVTVIESIDANDGQLYDNIVAGFVPEPSTLALMSVAGAFVFRRASRMRRR